MNKERCEQVLQWIEAHPENWNQEAWHCGTTHCFAGVAEMMRMRIDPRASAPFSRFNEEYCLDNKYETGRWLGFDLFNRRDAAAWDKLTSPDNTLDDLRRIIRGAS